MFDLQRRGVVDLIFFMAGGHQPTAFVLDRQVANTTLSCRVEMWVCIFFLRVSKAPAICLEQSLVKILSPYINMAFVPKIEIWPAVSREYPVYILLQKIP
jgi:hypothetical protein